LKIPNAGLSRREAVGFVPLVLPERRENDEFSGVVYAIVCAGEYVGWEEIDDGIWNVYFGPLKLGRLHERHMRIKDAYGRLNRHKV